VGLRLGGLAISFPLDVGKDVGKLSHEGALLCQTTGNIIHLVYYELPNGGLLCLLKKNPALPPPEPANQQQRASFIVP
jgi:hypothetical protein